jgi:intron-binding protein aquarius
MARQLKLHIVPHEAYPTQRLNNSVPQGAPQEVEDMPQMAAFVYEFYIQKVQAMKSAFYVSTCFYFNRMNCSLNLKYGLL